MESRNEHDRWLNGNIPRDFDNPFEERIFGLLDIGQIIVEGLTDAAMDGVKWLGSKAARAVDENLFDWDDD